MACVQLHAWVGRGVSQHFFRLRGCRAVPVRGLYHTHWQALTSCDNSPLPPSPLHHHHRGREGWQVCSTCGEPPLSSTDSVSTLLRQSTQHTDHHLWRTQTHDTISLSSLRCARLQKRTQIPFVVLANPLLAHTPALYANLGHPFCQNSSLHSSAWSWNPDKKKTKPTIEKAVDTLKEKKKKAVIEVTEPKEEVEKPQLSLARKAWDVVLHYYHGFRVLALDIRVAFRLFRLTLVGKQLTRREHKQFRRTVGDIFRVVPFSVFVIIPFMEFLLPVYLWLFPNALPSTFQSSSSKEARKKKELKVKLQMAKFLQGTIEEMAVSGRDPNKKETVQDFAEFFEKVPRQESHASPPTSNERKPFNFPGSAEEWLQADKQLAESVVPAVLSAASAEEKNKALCDGIYTHFSSKYGTKSSKKHKKKKARGGGKALTKLWKERNQLRSELRKAKKAGVDHQVTKDIEKAMSRNHIQGEAQKARKECANNFWRFASRVLNEVNRVAPDFPADVAESFFTDVYSSTPREYHQPEWLPDASPPQQDFDVEPISTEEIQLAIAKSRSHSSPSPIDQIPYLVFKRCPSLAPALTDLFNSCWRDGTIPSGWKQGVIRLIPKASAAEKPQDPSNFRPIAITSCVGKLFTTILKNRWLTFMTTNGYLDTSVQKAFLPGIPGCLEQYQKLSAVIREAHEQHQSLCVCWLDLANAYGSVHHQLIQFALKHYHAPQSLMAVVSSLYSDLSATITSRSWSTKAVSLMVGVYQGDPLSVVIFNTVMMTLADALKEDQHLGYTFAQSHRSINVLQYADDTCLIANGPASCQQLLAKVEKWLQWTGMKAKVPKCHSLAIQASTGKRYDPKLHLNGENIPFIADRTLKFLGGPIRVPQSTMEHRLHLSDKLSQLLDKVDKTPVTRKQKLQLYRAGICPRLNWDLSILELPVSWVSSTLEAKATRYLKKWSGLARSADPSRLYLPRSSGGLQLPSISLLYKKLRSSQAAQLLTSRDPVIQHITTMEIQWEQALQRPNFQAMQFTRDVMAEDPGASRRALVTRSKAKVTREDATKRREHAESLPRQGQLMRETEKEAAELWSDAVNSLPSESLKFALNAALDTLPYNSNLALSCKLCGRKQTLIHVLNDCPVALELRRYNRRHNSVLNKIVDFIKSHLPPATNIMADLPGAPYQYPSHIGTTDLRPNIVIWRENPKEVILLELTVCFETSFEEAVQRKTLKYLELKEEAQSRGYKAEIMTVEVGSRGVVAVKGFKSLSKALTTVSKREFRSFLTTIARTAILESHKIWCARNCRDRSDRP